MIMGCSVFLGGIKEVLSKIRFALLLGKINSGNGGNTYANYNTNEENMQVESGEIFYHIVSINSANHKFLDPTSQLGIYLVCLKFGFKQV